MDWPELIRAARRLAVLECRRRGRPVPRLSDRRVRRVLERHLQGCDDSEAVALLEEFDPSEPRDPAGEWTKGGGGGKKAVGKGKAKKAAVPGLPADKDVRGSSAIPPDSALPHLTAAAGAANDVQRSAVAHYSKDGYFMMNNALRGRVAMREQDRPHVEALSAWIDSQPPFAQPVTTWRGLSLPKDAQRAMMVKLEAAAASGEVIEMKGFSSTTLNASWAGTFAGMGGSEEAPVLFEVAVRKGAYLDGIGDKPVERELVLNHGARFRVAAIKDVPFKTSAGKIKRRVVQLEQIL